MINETDKCSNEKISCTAVVALGQNVQTYRTTQCKFLSLLKMWLPVFIGASWIQCSELC